MLKTLINRPLTVLTVFVLVTLLGLFMLAGMPVDLFPKMDFPYLYIRTHYPGASAEEVEETVTDILEEKLYTLEGLKSMSSDSSEGLSGIMLEFEYETDIEIAKSDVRDEINWISHLLADDSEDPIVIEFDPDLRPIMTITLQGDRNSEDLHDLAEDLLKPRLEQVMNVSRIVIAGGKERIVSVSVSANRLDAFGLSISSVGGALLAQNLTMGAGSVQIGDSKIQVRTSGDFTDLDQIRDTMIMAVNSGGKKHSVYIRDIAAVDFDTDDEISRVHFNGIPAVQLKIYKRGDANTITVAEDIQEAVNRIAGNLPDGIEARITVDESTIIASSLESVLNSAYIGVICAVLILMLFLRQVRSTLIIAVTIPVSILITIMGMRMADMTFNIVALTGLTLGVGMVVDNSIVIIENIFSHRQRGEQLSAAGLFGTKEMVNAITASTLTTISVFIPILFFGAELGFMGEVFGDLAFTIILALISSLMVAVLLVPVLSTHYLKIHTRDEKPIRGRFLNALDGMMEGGTRLLTAGYRKILTAALKRRALTILAFAAILAASLSQVSRMGLMLQVEPPIEAITLEAELPLGSSLDATEETMERIRTMAMRDIQGYTGISIVSGENETSYRGQLSVIMPPLEEREMNEDDIKEILRGYFDMFPETSFSFSALFMPGAEADINIQVQGDDLNRLSSYAEEAKDLILANIPGLTEITVNLKDGLPQWDIIINRNKAYDLGIEVVGAAFEINRRIKGYVPTTFTDADDNTYDVVVRLRERDRLRQADLEKLFVVNNMGRRIPVSSFASIKANTGPSTVPHLNKDRTVTIGGDLLPGFSTNSVEKQIRALLEKELPPEPGISLGYTGEMEDIRETGMILLKILAVAILLVFGVMVGQFESLRAPFIITLGMPMLAVGVIGIFLITGVIFDMFSLMGVVMLAGIVVNNGIVLVDYIGLLRKRGADLIPACLEGGVNRFRPILMTTLTTIATMVPLAFFTGEGGMQMKGLALTVVGGLSVNTVITLILVPVLYSLFYRHEIKTDPKEIEA